MVCEFSVITCLQTELLMIEKVDILNLDKETLNHIKNHTKKYLEDRDYRKMHLKTQKWNSYKASLVDNLIADKNNRKNDFKTSLRFYTPMRPKKLTNFFVDDPYQYKNAKTYQKLPPITKIYSITNPKLRDFIANENSLILPEK